jgi:hypothetical protein
MDRFLSYSAAKLLGKHMVSRMNPSRTNLVELAHS